MLTLVIFLAILAIVVLAHETGHFIAARKVGARVEEYGFGFPPRIFGFQIIRGKKLEKIAETEKISVEVEPVPTLAGEIVRETILDEKTEVDVVVPTRHWRFVWGNRDLNEEDWRHGTVYSLNWVPLGGFVKIKGENGDNMNDPDSLSGKTAWRRAVALGAGVAANILLAAVLFSVGYAVGLPQMTDEITDDSVVRDRRVEIMQVLAGKPAELAGLKSGDVFARVGELENPRLKEMQDYVDAHRSEKIFVTVRRDGELVSKEIQPTVYEDTGKGGLGVAIAEVGLVKYPWYKAIYHGFAVAGLYLWAIIVAFYHLIAGLFAGHGAGEAVAGPVGIAVMTGQMARLGFSYLIQFTAMLSLNLAVFNLLPLPALDGGRLFFIVIEKIIRRRVPIRFEQMAHSLGFLALMILVVVVTAKDLWGLRENFIALVSKIF